MRGVPGTRGAVRAGAGAGAGRARALAGRREGEAGDRALVVALDHAELLEDALGVGARRPHEDLRVLAHLPRADGDAVGVEVERGDVVVVAEEEQLLVPLLVVHDAERRRVVHHLLVGVVEQVLAHAPPGVAVDELQRERRHLREVVGLARVVGPRVVARRVRPPLERPVLDRVVERVVVVERRHVRRGLARRVGLEVLPRALLRAEAAAVEERRPVQVLVRVRPLALRQPALRQRLRQRPAAHRRVEEVGLARRGAARRRRRPRRRAAPRHPPAAGLPSAGRLPPRKLIAQFPLQKLDLFSRFGLEK